MKLLITTSTLPAMESDSVPAFVRDQALALKQLDPGLDILFHAPHNAYSNTARLHEQHTDYQVHRFHYFWPFSWERLTGRGILPALRSNRLLMVQIPFLFLCQFLSLLLLVRRSRPDLLYAHWFTPQAISTSLVSRITGVPFLFTTHASDVAVLDRVPGGSRLIGWVCRRACCYTAVSRRTADKLIARLPDSDQRQQLLNKLHIIPMGVAAQAATRDQDVTNGTPGRFGIPQNRIKLLFLGRLAEKKGVTYLLQAVAGLSESTRQRLHLVIAGDGQLGQQLQQQCRQLHLTQVTFTGYVTGPDKQALIQQADLVCFPSIIDSSGDAEGFPVAIMECLAAGRVILCSNVTGAEDVIADRQAGIVFPQQDVAALIRAIEQALALDPDSRASMQANAAALAADYDWPKIAAQHLQLLRDCPGSL